MLPKIERTLFFLSFLVVLMPVLLQSCSETSDEPEPADGNITFVFSHFIDQEPLKFDTLKYVNAAGNHFLVNEIQYFISDVKLHRTDGTFQMLDQWKDIHYVDTDLPETHTWQVFDPVEPGNFQRITFTFGINEEKNQSLIFVNPPERDMFWPEILGGGYHYMKLNGKWVAENQQVLPFDFHLGIGQIYSGGIIIPDSITGFVQNYFEVELPNSDFTVAKGQQVEVEIRMNVLNWFRNPYIYDHNEWGGDIMQNQEAMHLGCENGKTDVFSFIRKGE